MTDSATRQNLLELDREGLELFFVETLGCPAWREEVGEVACPREQRQEHGTNGASKAGVAQAAQRILVPPLVQPAAPTGLEPVQAGRDLPHGIGRGGNARESEVELAEVDAQHWLPPCQASHRLAHEECQSAVYFETRRNACRSDASG